MCSRVVAMATLAVMVALGDAGAQAGRAPSADEIRLYARLMSMTDTRSYDASLVDSALASSWAPLRSFGALSIGQVGKPRGSQGIPVLHNLLRDRDLVVASNAAYSIGLLQDSASVGTLVAALNGSPRVAREAAWALGEIGAPARTAIAVALGNPGTDDALTIQLLLASSKLRPVPVAAIRPHLRASGKPAVVWAAAYAIARTRAPSGVRDLAALAAIIPQRATAVAQTEPSARAGAQAYVVNASGAQRTRAEIARALSRQAAGDSLGDLAFPVLVRLASDPHPHVRINAVRSLATYDARGRSAVTMATRDDDANVRIAAAQSLGTVLDSATASWIPVWQRDTTFAFRSSLLASAARAGVRLPAMNDWSAHRDWHYRAAALNAAGASPDSAVASGAARVMLRDPDGRVRAAAYGILAGNDTSLHAPAVRQALLAGLRDRDFYARATIIGNLVRHASAAEAPAVLDTYAISLADSGNDARIAAIQYLASAWRRDSAAFTPALRGRIGSLAPSPDPLVRAAATGVSPFASWAAVEGNSRPLAWYQTIVTDYVVPAARGQTQRATISTRKGDIVLELFGADAPITVWNFMKLARDGYYKGTGFHRVVPNFVAQDGDPRDDGNGGPGYAIRDEMNPWRYERGALGMALSGPDTGGSQYFITHSPQPHLDGHYTVFGRVLDGLDVLDSIVQGDRILSVVAR